MKINKKMLVAGVAVLGLAALTAGGTIAYFTDTDIKTNTFTVGKVAIELKEQQRKVENGCKTTTLEDYSEAKVLYPIVGTAQGAKDSIGMPLECSDDPTVKTAKNYIDKMVTVKNTGNADAWVRVYFANRSELDDGFDTFNASKNNLHFNFGSTNDGATTYNVTWKWQHGNSWNYDETTIDGKNYNVYYADYMTTLASDATTTRAMNGLYLDKEVTIGDNGNLWGLANTGSSLVDLGISASEQIKFPVYVIMVQANGFDNAAAAVDASFGEHFDPFNNSTTTGTNWQ